MTVGFFLKMWEEINPLVTSCSSSQYKKVMAETEGVQFLNRYYNDKGLHRPGPGWMHRKEAQYPPPTAISRHAGLSSYTSSDSTSSEEYLAKMIYYICQQVKNR